MRIGIIALGSRGDVQPYIALGKGLHQAGHAVRLVSHEDYAQLAAAHGLDFWPVQGNLQEVVQSEEMRLRLENGNFLSIMTHAADKARVAALNWSAEGLAACRDREVLIAGIGALFVGLALAEKLNLPLLQAHYVPFTPTSAFPGALAPQSIPRILNRWSHHATRQMMWQTVRSADKPARQQVLGLPAAPFWGPYNADRLRRSPILYGFSPAVIPKPADWGAHIHLTGYWFLEAEDNWTPPADLQAFLAGGPPPVYVGFGSMGSRRPEETADLVLQALAKTGQRAIMLTGWGGCAPGIYRTPCS